MADYENQNQSEHKENSWQQPDGQEQNNGQWNQSPYGNQPPNWNSFDPRNDGSGNPRYDSRPPKQKNNFATAALVTGIFGILTLCCCAFPLSIIMGVGAISFAVISKRGQPFVGFAIAGIVLGIICIVGGVVEFIYVMAISFLMRDPEYAAMFNQIYEQMQQIQSGQ